jgi:tRNA threonylcarbamoyl adenosine modification protein YeaZ
VIAWGIETWGAIGSLALVDERGRVLAERTFGEKGTRHGQALVPSLEAALAEARLEKGAIDLLVVGTGPGSYTGLRVGIATGKALAYALRRPLAGVPSFDALAADLPAEALAGARSLVVAADARRERIYAGHYDPQTRARRGDFEVRAAERLLEGADAPIVLAGAGLAAYPALLAGARFVEAHPPARAIARLGLAAAATSPPGTFHDVKPLYLRTSLAAEE